MSPCKPGLSRSDKEISTAMWAFGECRPTRDPRPVVRPAEGTRRKAVAAVSPADGAADAGGGATEMTAMYSIRDKSVTVRVIVGFIPSPSHAARARLVVSPHVMRVGLALRGPPVIVRPLGGTVV